MKNLLILIASVLICGDSFGYTVYLYENTSTNTALIQSVTNTSSYQRNGPGGEFLLNGPSASVVSLHGGESQRILSLSSPLSPTSDWWYVTYSWHAADGSGSGTLKIPGDNTTSDLIVIPFGGVPPPVYTNYMLQAWNNLSGPATVTFYWNGAVVKQVTLNPGAISVWFSPPVEVSPVAEAAVGRVDMVLNSAGIYYNPDGSVGFTQGGGGDASGTININGGSGTVTTGGGGTAGGGGNATVSSSGGTNNFTLTSGTNSDAFTPNTNNILWQPGGTGGALDSTLRQVGNVTHSDLNNILSGMSVINKTLGTFGTMTTNELGQIITMEYIHTNYEGQMLTALVRISTNTPPGATNTVSLSLTNYAQETTLEALTNLLTVKTNGVNTNSYTSWYQKLLNLIPSSATNGEAAMAAEAAHDDVSGVSSLIDSLTPTILPDASPPPMTMTFMGRVLNFDPAFQFPSVVNASYIGFKIAFLLAFVAEIARMYWQVISIKASTSTGGVPDLEVFGGGEFLGTGGEFGGNYLGIAASILVPIAFTTIWVLAMGYLFSHLGVSISDAMNISAFQGALGTGYGLLCEFMPVNLLFTLVCTRITLSFSLGKIVQLASGACRWLWGK